MVVLGDVWLDFDPAALVATGLDVDDDLAFLALLALQRRGRLNLVGVSVTAGNAALRDTLAVCENDAMSKVARARRLRARQGPHSEQSIKRQSWQLASTVASPSLEMLGGVQLPAGMADVLQGGNLGRGANSPAPKEWYACVRACVPEREREHVGRAGSRTGETRSLL